MTCFLGEDGAVGGRGEVEPSGRKGLGNLKVWSKSSSVSEGIGVSSEELSS